jgi:hypothetical protein
VFRWSIVLSCILPISWSWGDETSVFEFVRHPAESTSLNQLFQQHYRESTVKGAATLWDMWLPAASLWYVGETPAEGEAMRSYWRQRLLSRPIDAEGYVGTCQHLGAAHSDGWPFPLWTQSEGIGFHFSLAHNPFLAGMNTPKVKSTEGWTLDGCTAVSLDESKGLVLSLDRPHATLTSPTFDIDSYVSPFVCIDLAVEGFADADAPTLSWDNGEGFAAKRQVAFVLPNPAEGGKLVMVPVYRHPEYRGRIKQWRIQWHNSKPCRVTLRAVHSAVDSRHNVNNPSLALGMLDYARWTGDLNFVRDALPKLWKVLDYALEEFHVREEGLVRTDWVGHDGRTGLDRSVTPKKLIRGRGIGSNYWDLLPFGSRDLMATIYMLAAIDRTSDLHRQMERHPEWGLPTPPRRLQADQLERIGQSIRRTSQVLFWNDTTGRYAACLDEDRLLHDYGYTYLNAEAIHYGLSTPSQAKSIYDWIDGRRSVLGDTSQGNDIYHFRFAPRATTKRNIDWYMFAWADPESIPWGGQVQDGGAVLAWSFHDVMSRLAVRGSSDAWNRLRDIAIWYSEVRQEGGYRAYYSKPGRGTLQGCGTAGGLGLDCEFAENLLVPLAIIEGFAGIHPTVEGCRIRPQLPEESPSLVIRKLFIHGHGITLELTNDQVTLKSISSGGRALRVFAPEAGWRAEGRDERVEHIDWQPESGTILRWKRDQIISR